MKLLNSFLALAALTLATSAFPQEGSPSPTPGEEEKASATVEATPEATKSPSATAETPVTLPTSERKESSPTATPSGRKTETATEARKTAAEPAAQGGKKMSAEAAIKENENRWEAAVAKHDISAVEALVAPDFMGVSSKGKFVNRGGLLGEYKSNKDTYTSTKIEKLNVRAFGKDVAVATGRAREKGTGKDGKSFDRTYLFTDTWMQRNGQWQCVAAQATLGREK